jgi:hypothetical protein
MLQCALAEAVVLEFSTVNFLIVTNLWQLTMSDSYKELLDDSLVAKLSSFTSKNRLNTQVTANCAT